MAGHHRREPRLRIQLGLEVRFTALGEFLLHVTHDVSTGGVFLRAEHPKPVGTLLRLRLATPLGTEPLSGVGRVVWIRGDSRSEEHPPGMGVKLVRVQESARARLAAHVGAALFRPRADVN